MFIVTEYAALKKLRQHCKIRFYYVLSDYSQASMVTHVDDLDSYQTGQMPRITRVFTR